MMFFYIQQMDTMRKSRLNLEQSMLQMEKLSIHEQINELQQKSEERLSAFSTITSGQTSQASSIFNQSVSNSNAMISDAQAEYNNAVSNNLPTDVIEVFKNKLAQAKEDSKTAQQQAYQEYQTQMTTVQALTQSFKKMQEAEEKAQTKELNKKEDRIELRLNQIKTELSMIDTELESATQASNDRAQKLAPKYA